MSLTSWLQSANFPSSYFSPQNLPCAVFQSGTGTHIGDPILNLQGCTSSGFLNGLPEPILEACRAVVLNPLISLGSSAWSASAPVPHYASRSRPA